ncbi:MAG: serine--tRNA ligase [Candidatus Magasanikbacteria bacterium]|jgi:seryl-tRNA synthetase
MLDIKFIRENIKLVKQNCINRKVKIDFDKLLQTDEQRRTLLKKVEELRATRNQKSKGKPTEEEIAQMRSVGDSIKEIESELETVELEYKNYLMAIPNLTHPDSPVGDEKDYKVVFQSKKPFKLNFTPKDHEELLIQKDLIDFERGTKVSGAKFYFTKNNLVRLNQALINYGIDVVTKHGFTLMETPDLAKNEILTGVGFNPRGNETQIYSIENTDLSLIGTAEITMGGYHADEVLDLNEGQKKYLAISHCFRTEAGAYGRTNKGLYRVHQFTKLEMFIYCKPEESEKLHQEVLDIEKEIIEGLGLNYRVIDIPSGDLGGPAYRKYDLEAWMTMNDGFGEITSCSNCTDYQSRRLNIKYRKDNGETELVHTLNGTAVVLSRFPIAIVEQYQQADGSILIPKVLQPYCGFERL